MVMTGFICQTRKNVKEEFYKTNEQLRRHGNQHALSTVWKEDTWATLLAR